MAFFGKDVPLSTGGGRAETRPSLREIVDFGSNPGDLPMYVSGHGFALIYAEQKRSNNDKACFSWFQPEDVRRGCGEVESIRQMVAKAVSVLSLDSTRINICGLSAGGAMANAMLATHPELFSAGAIIAGLPYGAANGASAAFEAMFMGRVKDADAWGNLVRGASTHVGPWPTISIWHGANDAVVRPINAGELLKQWTNVHDVGAEAPTGEQSGIATRRTWCDRKGRVCVIEIPLPGFGHGIPVDDQEAPAPFFIPSGLSATRAIADDFGLLASGGPKRLLSMIGLSI